MERTEHASILNRILESVTPEAHADVTELLTQLREDYEETLTTSEANAKQLTELTTQNETLRNVNAKLFLQVGTNPPTETPKDNPDVNNNDTPQLNFEDLFNEKGELK